MSKKARMTNKILGIDPGLRSTGFGIIQKQNNKYHYIVSGCIKSDKNQQNQNLSQRIGTIFDGISQIIQQYQPDAACIEKVFVNVNPHSTLLLGQARGAALAALSFHKLPVIEFSALQIKQAVTGNGKADKKQVQHMIVRLLNLDATPQSDAADALAAAICCGNHNCFV